MQEIKKCPYCGEDATLLESERPKRVLLGCNTEGCRGNFKRIYPYTDAETALKEWNTRSEV